jgi:hypothetical protein
MEDLVLPLNPEDGEKLMGTVWHDQCEALCVGNHADDWLGTFLKQDCRLVYQTEDSVRRVDPRYAKASDQVSFSDGFPFLLISENSLASLNAAMGLALPMRRFRPNLVVTGCDAYAEDTWREISIGGINFRLPKPCSRCSVPTIDPETALTGKEPLTTLNRLRKWEGKVYFGQNVLHDQVGVLTVGDEVVIKTTGEKQPPL